jgi:hypothetical protein
MDGRNDGREDGWREDGWERLYIVRLTQFSGPVNV